MANPDWVRDEAILALDVYFKDKSAASNKNHPNVLELSSFLNKLALFPDNTKDNTFRNPNGASMKLSYFRRLDPEYDNKGLKGSGGKLEEDVWNEFSEDRDRLKRTAETIRAFHQEVQAVD